MSENSEIRDYSERDQGLRNSMSELRTEPSPGTWKGIRRRLLWLELLRFNFTNVPAYVKVAVPVAALLITAGIVYLRPETPAPAPSVSPAPTPREVQTPVRETVPPAPVRLSESPTTEKPAVSVTSPSAPASAKAVAPVPVPTPRPVTESIPAEPSVAANVQPAPVAQPVSTTRSWERINNYGIIEFVEFDLTQKPAITLLENPVPPTPDYLDIRAITKPAPSRSLAAGLNVTPDMVFYNNESSYFRYDYTLDAGVEYAMGRFYLQSGLGVTYSSDIGRYDITYARKDSIGFYYAVSSFSPDPSDPSEVIFQTQKVTVFDSNLYYYDYNTENVYLYLQIPLTAGYRFIDTKHFALAAEAGGVYSYLFYKDEPAPRFYAPDSRIEGIERVDPLRLTNSFGILGGLRAEVKFARNWSFALAPNFKYYFNALKESSGNQAVQPWSVGIRAGIWYRFDLKTSKR